TIGSNDYIWTPASQLSASDSVVTVSYYGDEGADSLQPVSVNITVAEKENAGANKPQPESITVYMTFVDRGSIVVQDAPVVVYDEDEDGEYRIGDAFRALHRDYYVGGESGYAETSGNGVSGWVSRFWGGSDSTFSYSCNRSWVKSTQETIFDGDQVDAINGVDEDFYSDLFTWFDSSVRYAKTNEEISFTVKGLNLMGSDASYDALHAPAGATVKVYGANGGEIAKMRTVVDENGNFTLKFLETDTYTVEVSGSAVWGSYDAAPVAPSRCTVHVSGETFNKPEGEGNKITVSGGETVIEMEAKVEGGKAIVENIELPELDAVVGGSGDAPATTVTIDFSNLESDAPITKVELPAEAIKKIAEAISKPANPENPGNETKSLEIVLSNGAAIEFDAAALSEKISQTEAADITVSIEKHEDVQLTDAQKQSLGNRPAFDINVTSGGKNISDMGSKISIHAPYELKSGEKARGLVVWYVDNQGHKERCETRYDSIKKRVNWKTDHLSLYMIDYDETLANNPFTDVAEDAYYFDAVLWALDAGITNGTGDTTFSPAASCTRAQMVTFLWRASGSPKATAATCAFTDVDKDAYYYEALLWAVENGITNGTSDTTFSPNAVCSRGQMATFLYRNAKTPAVSGGHAFTDVKADAYYNNAVIWAAEQKITNGTSDTAFSPDADCTRGQMVTFLYRYLAG
ncbi:MAG: hypothetical protein E7472_07410, partial [Ruminococcaceae bacterium]|nr:hypothetical protein [Oscillospiraceae bacterium]